jgi:hypothetical protein
MTFVKGGCICEIQKAVDSFAKSPKSRVFGAGVFSLKKKWKGVRFPTLVFRQSRC